jgi:tetratricopeptide (TPR) repeat protein
MARALFMPLANPWVSRGLAGEMQLHGEIDLAVAQLFDSARWSTLIPAESLAVLETLAEYSSRAGDHEKAAQAIAAALIMLMNQEVYAQLGDRALYFAFFLAAELERARMNMAIDAGDWPEAQASLARSLAYLPQTEAAIDLVTHLDAAGRNELADRIFSEVFGPLFNSISRYPQSSLLCNQAAWLAASCSRRLDTALHLAQSAVNSDPASPAAMDTLAEVYLRRGQPQRALELLERILALAEAQDSVGTFQSSQFSNYLKRRREFLDRLAATRSE